ncbi:MAG: PD-(D/E)XK nuclease family protein, partial [Hyphomicrobiaceae bacterium]
AHLYGPSSRAEVAVGADIPRPEGRGPALKLSGQIDRLAVHGDTVYIVDYKTNRPPPQHVDGVADAYIYQLAASLVGVADMFRAKPLRAAILGPAGPRLLPILADKFAAFAPRLWRMDVTRLDAGATA